MEDLIKKYNDSKKFEYVLNNKTRKKIYELILSNNNLTQVDISKKLNILYPYVAKHILILCNKKLLIKIKGERNKKKLQINNFIK